MYDFVSILLDVGYLGEIQPFFYHGYETAHDDVFGCIYIVSYMDAVQTQCLVMGLEYFF